VNGNYNACLTQNANVIVTELRYLLNEGPVAQRLEQRTHKLRSGTSNKRDS